MTTHAGQFRNRSLEYRPEIDGLRAIAVGAVVLFHADIRGFSGGFVGVDIFFVISGYLITSILLGDLEQNRFSIARFYERRARRIFPALFAVLTASIVGAYLLLTPGRLSEFAASLAASIAFVSNIYFWHELDYFAAVAEEQPLLHMWSLAVEEQFYLFFPLALYLFWRFAPRDLFIAMSGVAAASLIWSEIASSQFPASGFYLIFSRAWELLAGSLCALSMRQRSIRPNGLLAACGLILIGLSILMLDEKTPFPSIYALAPIAGSVLLVLYGSRATVAGRLLASPAMVGVGLISYSTYLVHQPLLAFARLHELQPLSLPVRGAIIALSFALGYVSWRFVEAPFRRKTGLLKTRRAVFGWSLAGGGALLAAAAAMISADGLPGRYAGKGPSGYDFDNQRLQEDAWILLEHKTGDPTYRVENNPADQRLWFSDARRPNLLVVGNSHSKDMYNVLSLSDVAKQYEIARYGIQLRALADPAHVFYQSSNFRAADVVVLSTRYWRSDISALPAVLDRLQKAGKRIVVIGSAPEFPANSTITLGDQIVLRAGRDIAPGLLAENVNRSYFKALKRRDPVAEKNRDIAAMARKAGVPYRDRRDFICDEKRRECFGLTSELEKPFYDGHHMTLAGARFFATRVDALRWFPQIGTTAAANSERRSTRPAPVSQTADRPADAPRP